jgi:hypothetical protein
MLGMRRARRDELLDGPRVESFGLDARRLVTIGPDHPWWGRLDKGDRATLSGDGFENAIVRVQPPASATDEMLESVRRALARFKVAAMRFESRAQEAVAVQHQRPAKHASLREIVMLMAESSTRREELRALLDLELAKVGQ